MPLADLLTNASYQKVLRFLSDNPNKTFFEREISDKTGVSRGATNLALRKLAWTRLVILQKKGRMSFYSVDLTNPVIRYWKVLNNILGVYQLMEKLKKVSEKIILFGSASKGTNIKESDVDLFVITDIPEKVNKLLSKSKRRVQLIVKRPLEFVELKEKDPVFYDEVMRGITLWEKTS